MRLSSLQLKTQDPKQSITFYTTVLGMTLVNKFEHKGQIIYLLQFPNNNCSLELFYNQQNLIVENYQESRLDNYWKFSVFVENIQQTYHFLNSQNILTNEPYQFGEIGYLMHTKDKENYQIEFIQKTFKQDSGPSFKASDFSNSIEDASLGLITIRTKDPVKSIHFFESLLDMKLLVRMHVNRGNGFSLYFLGGKHLNAPNQNLDAIENRKWLYQQSEPFIELQYYWGSEYQDSFMLKSNDKKNMGLRSIKFEVENLNHTKQFFSKKNINFVSSFSDLKQKETIQIMSPDEQLIIIE